MSYYPRASKEFLNIFKGSKSYKLQPSQIIQSTEDRRAFNWLRSGYIKRYLIGNDGSLGVQVIYGPGDLFPITLAFNTLLGMEISESKEVYYYEAITDVEICSIPTQKLKDEVDKNPHLYKDLMAIGGKRLHSTLNGLENLTMATSHKRIAHQLAYLGRRFGQKHADGIAIKVPLTNKDLAEILTLTRPTVSAGIVKLRKKGLIKTETAPARCIIIRDMDRLMAEAFS